MFGRSVSKPSAACCGCCHGSYIDDGSSPLFFHNRDYFLAKNKWCCEICCKNGVPFIHCNLIHIGSCSAYSCIIYENVNFSVGVQSCFNQVIKTFIRCHVCFTENCFSSGCLDFIHTAFSQFFLCSNNYDFCSFFCKEFCGCSSDSSC